MAITKVEMYNASMLDFLKYISGEQKTFIFDANVTEYGFAGLNIQFTVDGDSIYIVKVDGVYAPFIPIGKTGAKIVTPPQKTEVQEPVNTEEGIENAPLQEGIPPISSEPITPKIYKIPEFYSDLGLTTPYVKNTRKTNFIIPKDTEGKGKNENRKPLFKLYPGDVIDLNHMLPEAKESVKLYEAIRDKILVNITEKEFKDLLVQRQKWVQKENIHASKKMNGEPAASRFIGGESNHSERQIRDEAEVIAVGGEAEVQQLEKAKQALDEEDTMVFDENSVTGGGGRDGKKGGLSDYLPDYDPDKDFIPEG